MDGFRLVHLPVSVNLELEHIDGIAQFGKNCGRGVGRVAASDHDFLGRHLDGDTDRVVIVVHEADGSEPAGLLQAAALAMQRMGRTTGAARSRS